MKEAGTTRPRFTAFASTDCHTCLSGNRKCERQRPYCSTCLERGVKCGGYVTPLSWHESRAYSGRESSRRHQQWRNRRSDSTTERAGTFHLVQRGSQKSKKSCPLIFPQTEDHVEQHSVSPEVTHSVIESEASLTDTAYVDSLLDNLVSETYPESDTDHDPTPSLPITSSIVHAHPPWTGRETENDEITDYEKALPRVLHSTAAAANHPDPEVLTPGNLLLGSDIALSFEWSNMEWEDTQSMLDSAFSTFPLAPSFGWRQQHEMALRYCKHLFPSIDHVDLEYHRQTD